MALKDLFRRNRSPGRDDSKALLSGRMGSAGGRPTRTFHVDFRGVTVAQPAAKGGSIDYLAREGDYAGKEDLLYLAGSSSDLREAIAAVDAGCRIRKGKTAERVAIATVFELPAATTREAAEDVAEEIVAHWRRRGHPAIAAVHDPAPSPDRPEGWRNLHIHVLTTARPCRQGREGWGVDRSPLVVPLRGKQAVRDERAEVAELVNRLMARHGIEAEAFHGGRLVDTGIIRPAKKRVPEKQYRLEGQHDRDPVAIEKARERILTKQAKKAEARQAAEKIRRTKIVCAARRLGMVSKAEAAVEAGIAAKRARRELAQPAAVPLKPLSDRQLQTLADLHDRYGLELPDLDSAEGRSMAFGILRLNLAQRDTAHREERKARRAAFQAAGEAVQGANEPGTPSPSPSPLQPPKGRKLSGWGG